MAMEILTKPLDAIVCHEHDTCFKNKLPVSDQEGTAAEEMHAAGRNFVSRLNVLPAIEC